MLNGIKITKINKERNYRKEYLVIDTEEMDVILEKNRGKLSLMYDIEITSNSFGELKEYFRNTYSSEYFKIDIDRGVILINRLKKGVKRKINENIEKEKNYEYTYDDIFDEYTITLNGSKIVVRGIDSTKISIDAKSVRKEDVRKVANAIAYLIKQKSN